MEPRDGSRPPRKRPHGLARRLTVVAGGAERPVGRGRRQPALRAANIGPSAVDPALVAALRRAIDEDQIVPRYQPIVDLATAQVVGAEALLRWRGVPEPELADPRRLLDIAARAGLSTTLTDRLLTQVCCDFARADVVACGLWVSFNLNEAEILHPDLVGRVQAALVSSGLRPQQFLVEVAEALIGDPAVIAAFERLEQLGIRLGVDDFGTGASTVAQLTRLPSELVKLDQSLLVNRTRNDPGVLWSSVAMLSSLGLTVLIEGVETWADFQLARSANIALAQGFLWSDAVPIDVLVALVRALDRPPWGGGERP